MCMQARRRAGSTRQAEAEMAFQVMMMMKKTMSRKRGRLRGSLKTAKGKKKGIKIQPKVTDGVGNHTSMFSSQLPCDKYLH